METTTTCEFCGQEFLCAHCRKWFPREETRTAPDGKLCEHCFDELCSTCDNCGVIVYRDELTSTPGYTEYCEVCYSEHCTTCNSCHDSMWTSNAYADPNDNDLCESCYDENCVCCEGCSDTIWRSDAVDCCDGYYCASCAPDEDCHDSAEFVSDDRHNRMVSKRRFGVEIETHSCADYSELGGNVPFEIKEDCSVRGKEFASVILAGDKGLEAIEDLCNFGADHDWTVNDNCGLHIHLDMSKEKTEALKATTIAYLMTRDFWLSYVTEDRHHNSYCGENNFDISRVRSITKFNIFSRKQSRYEWLNVAAYSKHKTFEVRVHQGSINTDQICNWIRIHALFVDWAASKTCDEVIAALECVDRNALLGGICHAAGCDDLVAYYHLTPAKLVV